MDNKSKKRPGGAEKHRDKKLKSLEVEAAKCAKLTDLFGAGFTGPAADERGGLDNDERVEADMAERVDSSMDKLGMDVTGDSRAGLVILAFLQADCQGAELRKELHSLSNEFHLTRDINCKGPRIDTAEVGSLEAELSSLHACFLRIDSRVYEIVPEDLHDIQPVAEPQGQWNQDAAANIQQVVEEIREVAAQLQESVMAQATNNLMRNRSDSQSEWKTHLKLEVEQILRNGTGLEHLPHERLVMALTLTLVKGVFQQAPQLLRSLFNAALQLIR